MDDIHNQTSTSSSNTFLSAKTGCTDFQDLRVVQMEPGDAAGSKYEEAILKEKILLVLSGTYGSSDVLFLYKNEHFLYDPSNLSFYEDETELGNNFYNETKNAIQKNEVLEGTVSVVVFPREQHAELVALMEKKKNILRRMWKYISKTFGCVKREED